MSQTIKLKNGHVIVLPDKSVFVYPTLIRNLLPYHGESGIDRDSIFLMKKLLDKKYKGFAFRFYNQDSRKEEWAYFSYNTVYRRGSIVAFREKFNGEDVIMLKVYEQDSEPYQPA